MKEEDVKQVHALLNEHLAKYKVHMTFTADEIHHFLMPRENVMVTYVLEQANGDITDMFSFYSLPSSILKHPNYKTLSVAYSYYNVSNTVPLEDLMKDALIIAKEHGFDVFNALDCNGNQEFLEPLKFSVGDGALHYYLYNWRISTISPNDIGIVLV